MILPCPPRLQVVLYRWNVYNVFLQVPSAVIRALASRVLVLLEDDISGDAPTNEGEPQEVSKASRRAHPWELQADSRHGCPCAHGVTPWPPCDP